MIANFTHPGRKDNKKLHLSTFFLSLGIELRVCIILQLREETFSYLMLPGKNISKKESKIANIEREEHFD